MDILGDIRRYSTDSPTPLASTVSPCLELTFAVHGTAVYQVGDRTRQLGAGAAMWVYPSCSHALLTASPSYRCWIASFAPALVDRVCDSFAPAGLREGSREGAAFRKLSPAASVRLAGLFEDLFVPEVPDAESVVPNPAALSYLLMSAWAEQSYADDDEQAGHDLHPAVEKAATLLRTEAANNTLEDLARLCGASSAWLSRLFRQQMGISLVDYRNQHRIERFFELYRNGHRLNITQAALEAGFGSYAQFHRVFRKRVGYGPAELRRRLAAGREAT